MEQKRSTSDGHMVGGYSRKEKSDYNVSRDRISSKLGIDKNAYNAYRRHANALSDADTNSANGTRGNRNHYSEPQYSGNKIVNAYSEKHYDADTKPIHEKLKKMTKEHGLSYYHQTDPRGASLYLSKNKLTSDNYSQSGEAIQ